MNPDTDAVKRTRPTQSAVKPIRVPLTQPDVQKDANQNSSERETLVSKVVMNNCVNAKDDEGAGINPEISALNDLEGDTPGPFVDEGPVFSESSPKLIPPEDYQTAPKPPTWENTGARPKDKNNLKSVGHDKYPLSEELKDETLSKAKAGGSKLAATKVCDNKKDLERVEIPEKIETSKENSAELPSYLHINKQTAESDSQKENNASVTEKPLVQSKIEKNNLTRDPRIKNNTTDDKRNLSNVQPSSQNHSYADMRRNSDTPEQMQRGRKRENNTDNGNAPKAKHRNHRSVNPQQIPVLGNRPPQTLDRGSWRY